MNRVIRTSTLIPILVLAMAASGCATTAELDKMRADIQSASDRAASAQASADAAMAEAKAARAAAENAERAALDAKAAAEATDEKIDRMFKQTMNK